MCPTEAGRLATALLEGSAAALGVAPVEAPGAEAEAPAGVQSSSFLQRSWTPCWTLTTPEWTPAQQTQRGAGPPGGGLRLAMTSRSAGPPSSASQTQQRDPGYLCRTLRNPGWTPAVSRPSPCRHHPQSHCRKGQVGRLSGSCSGLK